LGALAWLLAAWTAQRLARTLFPAQNARVPWVALACLLEWHLAWAALSGMEITLYCWLALLLLEQTAARAGPLRLGLLGGLLAWVRPEGLILAALALPLAALTRQAPHRSGTAGKTLRARLLALVAGFAIALAPYLILNLTLSGQPFPSTLYAKQAEYRILLNQPIGQRLWVVVRRPLVGAQVLLLPGFVWQAYAALRQGLRALHAVQDPAHADRCPPQVPFLLAPLLPLAWWAALHLLYALRLPVDYQHGRYLIPTLPILLTYGVTGTRYWLCRATRGTHRRALFTRVWTQATIGSLYALAIAFLVLGGRQYAGNRRIIQLEMVDVAHWLRAHTPPHALVAAHDIGAIGYWAQRPLLDLAGLVNPEVIPFMRDETRLFEFVVDHKADYLVTFPSWYPTMVLDERLTRIYPDQDRASPLPDQESMTVYLIHHELVGKPIALWYTDTRADPFRIEEAHTPGE
jgi:hypothetical protein